MDINNLKWNRISDLKDLNLKMLEMDKNSKDFFKEAIEKNNKEIEKLEQEIKKEEQPTVSATGVLLQKKETEVFVVKGDNKIVHEPLEDYKYGEDCFNINNAFVNLKQAEQEALRREGQEFIRRCAMLWNKDNDWRIDMSAETEYMYYIGYGFRSKLFVVKTDSFVTVGTICFDTQELAEKCIAELKAKYNEEQQKTIFGVK